MSESHIKKTIYEEETKMPESQAKNIINEDEAKQLFYLWNDALDSLDPNADFDSIKDYFVNFLQLKPNGENLESIVTTGEMMEEFPEDITEEQVRSLFYLWNDALATGDSRIVAKRYSSDPILLPTVSDTPRTDYEGIKDSFDHFLTLKPRGEILEGKIKIGPGWAKDAGIYQFTMGANGEKVKGRYTYLYVIEKGQWKIAHHHSSLMPESHAKKAISKDEAKNLFHLWNDALDTLDPDAVAKRYAKNGVLLPTASDVPRADYDSIKDYFVNFLKLKPQGEILESYVTSGENWCKDVGIYEFTMGTTGDRVKARYSFVYIREDGQWKISHHHSSKMPEAPAGKQSSEDEVSSMGLASPHNIIYEYEDSDESDTSSYGSSDIEDGNDAFSISSRERKENFTSSMRVVSSRKLKPLQRLSGVFSRRKRREPYISDWKNKRTITFYDEAGFRTNIDSTQRNKDTMRSMGDVSPRKVNSFQRLISCFRRERKTRESDVFETNINSSISVKPQVKNPRANASMITYDGMIQSFDHDRGVDQDTYGQRRDTRHRKNVSRRTKASGSSRFSRVKEHPNRRLSFGRC